MKPVVVFRNAHCDGAGYLGSFLNEHAIPWHEVRLDLNDNIPSNINQYSGLVLMGGPMSVNDDLPWIPQTIQLIRKAVDQDIPVIGHCLGGQLISKALGAEVTTNVVHEIGWAELTVHESEVAERWFGETKQFLGFHWHGETFSLPAGATRLLSSEHCLNQAYVLGKHLALQCHTEMTDGLVKKWVQCWAEQLASFNHSPAVQSQQDMLDNLSVRVQQLNKTAHHLYSQWINGLAS